MQPTIWINSLHTRGVIDIREIKTHLPEKPLSESTTDLFYQLEEGQYVYITHYGAVVFYHVPEVRQQALLQRLVPKGKTPLTDRFGVVIDGEADLTVAFDHITIKRVDYETIKIIMLNMAQSIALMDYDSASQDMITRVRLYTSRMEQRGRLRISKTETLKFIGKALNTQNRIAENLYIFDAPPITWEHEFYNELNTRLAAHFELSGRFKAIENTLRIVEANLEAFLQVNHHDESSRLEWIIIILILVEVVDTFLVRLL